MSDELSKLLGIEEKALSKFSSKKHEIEAYGRPRLSVTEVRQNFDIPLDKDLPSKILVSGGGVWELTIAENGKQLPVGDWYYQYCGDQSIDPVLKNKSGKFWNQSR